LFGARAKDVGFAEPILEAEEEWPQVLRLSKEKEVLGFYFSGNPLENYRQELELFATTEISGLEAFRDGDEVILGGMIGEIKTKIDKKGKRMAFVGIEDITGRTELVVFSDVYERSRLALHPEKLVLTRGRVSTKEGEKPKLVASEIYPLEEGYVRTLLNLTITFVLDREDSRPVSALNVELAKLLSSNGGGTSLYLRLISEGETVLARAKKGSIRLSREILANLCHVFGQQRVVLQKETGPFFRPRAEAKTASSSPSGANDEPTAYPPAWD
jgi:DNA polymerase-3 subunit alpha